MKNFIPYLVEKISKSNPEFSDLQLKKMEYGLTCIFDEITKLIPYYIIFWIFSVQKYYIIALIFFCPIRLFSGGYHARTYWGCFIMSFIIFSTIIIVGKYIIINNIISVILLIISFVCICIFSPADNVNRRIKSSKRKKQLNKYSIVITFILIASCYFIPNKILTTAVISILGAVIMMLIGKLNI